MSGEVSLDGIGDNAPQPFRIIRPLGGPVPFVYNAPHSGTYYPPDLLERNRLPVPGLRSSEDSFADLLFADAPALGAPLIRANYARAYVDTNRDAAELDPNLFDGPLGLPFNPKSERVRVGLGVIPSVVAAGQSIYAARLPAADAARRLQQVYFPVHDALRILLDEAYSAFGCVVLVDCHSMPSGKTHVANPARQSSDIVIGDAHGQSALPVITRTAVSFLRSLGYRVAVNAPYAGGYNTRHYGRPHRSRHALQIEINRALYMDEERFERTSGFDEIRTDMGRLMETLHSIPLEDLQYRGSGRPHPGSPLAAE